jgi:hypothetical protein
MPDGSVAVLLCCTLMAWPSKMVGLSAVCLKASRPCVDDHATRRAKRLVTVDGHLLLFAGSASSSSPMWPHSSAFTRSYRGPRSSAGAADWKSSTKSGVCLVCRSWLDDDSCMKLPQDMDRWMTLGQIVEHSVHMEVILRRSFCALMGSKCAAIVAGGQDTSWLIDNCRAIVKFHRELAEEKKAAISDALTACSEAYGRRNQLVHGWWDPLQDEAEVIVTRKSRRRTFKDLIERWTLDEMHAVDWALFTSSNKLQMALVRAMGGESMKIGQELEREEG